jgi:hypothetical protein
MSLLFFLILEYIVKSNDLGKLYVTGDLKSCTSNFETLFAFLINIFFKIDLILPVVYIKISSSIVLRIDIGHMCIN